MVFFAEDTFCAPSFFNWLTVFFAREETLADCFVAVFLALEMVLFACLVAVLAFLTPVLAAVLACLSTVADFFFAADLT